MMVIFAESCTWNIPLRIFSETAEDAAKSWESAVDMVEARIPARITPAPITASTPFSLNKAAIRIMIVSESDPERNPIAPTSDMARPTMPIKIATAIEITTHTEAILLDLPILSSFSVAINRRRMWGIPKYPRPHANEDAMVIIP